MDGSSAERIGKHAVWLAIARAGFGAPAVLAPTAVVRMLCLSRNQSHAYRLFAGFFGVRELLLGGFILAARRDFSRLRPTVAFGALADLGDTALLVREVVQRKKIEPAVAFLLFSGVAGSLASTALWWEVRQGGDQRATPAQ